jgi:acetolactate synthase-1/2/3 large subunit
MGAYYRASGNMSIGFVTAGGGSTNAVTGVVSNWADSIPGIIISGQEQNKFIEAHKTLRMYGIQGYDSPEMVKKVTKFSKTLTEKSNIQFYLDYAYEISLSGRPGPVWLDIPFDTQSAQSEEQPWEETEFEPFNTNLKQSCNYITERIKNSKRPVIIAGHGIRLSNSKQRFRELSLQLKIPVILTWSGIDILPENHPYNFGRSGIMGQRSSNFIVQNSDLVISLGSRLSLLQTGYDIKDFATNADLIIVDADEGEANKHKNRNVKIINADVKDILDTLTDIPTYDSEEWLKYCNKIRDKYPKLIKEHSSNKYINSYEFVDKLSNELNDTDIIVTDMGTGLLSGHYSIKLKENQIMFTSLGLGEMGYGLPGAIGASFTDLSKNVICLNCDGGMMMNLQELQTIKHHNLPIKIVIFNNDGYLMIKHTQKMLFNGNYNGVNANTGLSLPEYKKISNAFDFPYFEIKTWEDYNKNIKNFLNSSGPAICEVFMDPEQDFIPKVKGIKKHDGTIFSPPIEEMSPLLPFEEVKENMISGLNEKSLLIQR